MITQTPRQQLQTLLEESLYHDREPQCKRCGFPLSPHQQTVGLCCTCECLLAGLRPGPRADWDFMAGDVEGYRG